MIKTFIFNEINEQNENDDENKIIRFVYIIISTLYIKLIKYILLGLFIKKLKKYFH